MKRIGIVGCGRIVARHIEAIQANAGLEIACVCDVNATRLQEISQRLGVPAVASYQDMPDVDVISVLTPSGLHPRHVMGIAEHCSAPFILCEKPLSLTVREACEMLDFLDQKGKMLLPVYQNRYNPLVVYLKNLVDSGQLGALHQFICNVLWNRNDVYFQTDWHGTRAFDGGVLYTQASHYVDMVHYLFGEVLDHKGIGGQLRGLEVFDSVSAVMRFENGVVGSLNATVCAYRTNYQTEFTLLAENGVIRLAGTNLNAIVHWDVKGVEKPNLDFTLDHVYGKGHDTLYSYIQDEKWEMFPSRADVISGIRLMEMLSY